MVLSSEINNIKLQQVMGHSDMKVSLTYLRGLEAQCIVMLFQILTVALFI
jgi:hypothetical protein